MRLWNKMLAGTMAAMMAFSSLPVQAGYVRAEEIVQEATDMEIAENDNEKSESAGVQETAAGDSSDVQETETPVQEELGVAETGTQPTEEKSQEVETEIQEKTVVEDKETAPQGTNDETKSTELTTQEEMVTETDESETEETDTALELITSDGNIASGNYKDITWVIDADGKLTVTGKGDFSDSNSISRAPWYHYCESIKSAEISVADITDASCMFYGCSKLENVDLNSFDTSKVTNMSNMFSGCSKLTSVDLSGINTSQVTSMLSMFYGCSRLTDIDLSGIDTSKVTNIGYMFYGCSSLPGVDVSGIDTSQVTYMGRVFEGCSSLTSVDLSNFDISKVTNISLMFAGCSSLPSVDLSGLDASQVTSMNRMFEGCSGLRSIDMSGFKANKVTNISLIFNDCKSLTSVNFSGADFSSVTDMSRMLYGCSVLTSVNFSGADFNSVTNMGRMFYGCTGLTNVDVSSFNTSQVTDMSYMFYGCSELTNVDVSSFNTSQVTDMSYMFYGCSGLTNVDVSSFNTSQVTDISFMFAGCSSLLSVDLSGLDISQVTNIQSMFEGCSGLITVNLSRLDTSQVTNMVRMFEGCKGLTSVNFSDADFSSVTNMSRMFFGCISLTDMCLSSFDTKQVTNMSYMFAYCSSLFSVDLSGFDISQVTDMSGMFSGCSALTALYTPRNLSLLSVSLNGNWYKPDGTKISKLPQNLDYSILIMKDKVPSVTDPNIKVTKKKTIYECGDILNVDDLTVKYYGTDGTVKKVTDYTTNTDDIDMSVSGEKLLTVTYRGFSAQVKLTVNEKQEPSGKQNVNISGITMSDSEYTGRPTAYSGSASVQSQDETDITDKVTLTYTYSGTMADNSPYADTDQAPVNAGEYTLTVAVGENDENYIGSRQYTFKITKAPIKITASDITLETGRSLPAEYEYQVTGLLNGDELITEPSFTCNADMTKEGKYKITPYGADLGMNYEVVYIDGTLTVVSREEVTISGIKISNSEYTGRPTAYSGSASVQLQDGTDITDKVTLTYTYSGTMADNSPYADTDQAPVNAGEYTLTVAVGEEDENYTGSRQYTFKITQASVEITASDITLFTGDEVPQNYEYQVKGLLNGDTLAAEPSFTCNADMTKAGKYKITPYGADLGMNYEAVYIDGTLTVVSKEEITISGIQISNSRYTGRPIAYSGSASVQSQDGTDITDKVTLTYTYSGIMADNSPYADTDQAPVNAGEYTLTVAVGEDDEKYAGSKQYTFRITKAYIYITASNLTLDAGSSLPLSYEYQIEGLLNEDVLLTEPSFTCDADMEKEGIYEIEPYGADAGMNYQFIYNKGLLTVKGEPYGSYKGIIWNIDDDGKLTVQGTGDFSDSGDTDRVPWFFHRADIVSAKINVSGMTDASYMFYDCKNLSSVDLSGLDAGSIINMRGMFSDCSSLTSVDLKGLDLSNVNSMREMFWCSGLVSIDLSGVSASAVTDIGYMFSCCENLSDVNFSNADFSSVTNRRYIFEACDSLASVDFSDADFRSVISLSEMFAQCENLRSVNFSGADFRSVISLSGMFSDWCGNLASVDFSNADFRSATSLYGMFYDCTNLTSLDFSGADFSSVKSVEEMFPYETLVSVDFSEADFSSVTSLRYLLGGCSKLERADFKGFVIKEIEDMEGMFSGCSSLESIDLSSFITDNVESMGYMFSECSSLKSIDLSSFVTNNVRKMEGMFSGCSGLESIDLSNFNACNVDSMSDIFSECNQLETIYTPYNLKASEKLSGNWYKTDGTTISTLPRNLDYSILIMKNHIPSVSAPYIKAVKRKTVYKCGDILYTDDLTVKCYDTEGTARIVTDYTTNADKIDMTVSGTKALLITYRGYTTEIPLIVENEEQKVKISGIKVSNEVYTGRPYAYTGSAAVTTASGTDITKEVSLTYTYTGTLADGTVYEASSAAPVNAGNYKLTIEISKEDSNYKGSAEYAFKITKAPVEIAASYIILFAGNSAPTVYKYQVKGLLNGDELVKEPSFTCNVDMSKAGTYEIVPYGADAGINYEIAYTNGMFIVREDTGEKETITISKGGVSDSVYTGKAYSGKVSVKLQNGLDITDGVALTYSYSGTQADGSNYGPSENAPVNVGTYTLTAAVPQDNEHYTGHAEYSFAITKAPVTVTALDVILEAGKSTALLYAYPYEVTGLMENDKLTAEPSFIYTDMDGNEISRDSINLKEIGSYYVIPKEADAGMNYAVNYQKGILTIKETTGNLPDDEKDSEVLPGDIPETGIPKEGVIWTSAVQDQQYTGAAVKPALRVYCGGRLLTEKTDYTLSYKNNKKLGTADIIITGKGNYSEKKTVHFNIVQKSISDKDIIVEDMAYPNDGRQHKAPPVVSYNGRKLKLGTDFTIEYGEGDYTAAGDYYAVITGKGNYTGTVENVKTTIIDKSMFINKAKVAAISKQEYSKGQAIVLPDSALTVTLNGKTLEKDTDYTVTYINNCNVGKASVVIKGTGSYAGTKTASFKIVRTPVDISTADISCDYIRETAFVKGGCMPEPKVSYDGDVLKKGVDYTVSYKNNKKTGSASFTVKGKGSFKGSRQFAFTIKQKELSAVDIRVPDIVYSNKAGRYSSKPILTDTDGKILKAGTDYTITGYACNGETLVRESNPPEGSEITVTVQGMGNYGGSVSASYKLRTGVSLSKAKITVADQTYTGKAVKPAENSITGASIKASGKTENLVYGRDYEIIAYGSNIKSGSGTIVLRGLGNYYGEKTIKFRIVKKSVGAE